MTTLYDLVEATCTVYPGNTALEVGDTALTYAELSAQADHIARETRHHAHGSVAQRRVALFVTRTPETYLGYVGAIKAGAAVVPVSGTLPVPRLRSILRAAGVSAALSAVPISGDVEELLRELDVPVIRTDQIDAAGLSAGRAPQAGPEDDELLAYILFTSGSTGTPKGVPITHRNACAYVRHVAARHHVTPASRLSQTFELTFDPSVFDLFAAWSSGATVVVPEGRELMLPTRYVNERRITHWYSVPSVISLASRIDALPQGGMPGLEHSQFIGERLTVEQARLWQRAAPRTKISNVYGPTELTVSCAEYTLPDKMESWPITSNGSVPIGEVYRHLEWSIVGEGGRLSDIGELCVRGVQRFNGYISESDDSERFLAIQGGVARIYDGVEPLTPRHWYRTGDLVRVESGNLVHLGRLDRQVKVNGYRIELDEIENALLCNAAVSEAAVIVHREGPLAEIRAALVGTEISNAELSGHILSMLPSFMVPRKFRWTPELPLSAHGKVDLSRVSELLRHLP